MAHPALLYHLSSRRKEASSAEDQPASASRPSSSYSVPSAQSAATRVRRAEGRRASCHARPSGEGSCAALPKLGIQVPAAQDLLASGPGMQKQASCQLRNGRWCDLIRRSANGSRGREHDLVALSRLWLVTPWSMYLDWCSVERWDMLV